MWKWIHTQVFVRRLLASLIVAFLIVFAGAIAKGQPPGRRAPYPGENGLAPPRLRLSQLEPALDAGAPANRQPEQISPPIAAPEPTPQALPYPQNLGPRRLEQLAPQPGRQPDFRQGSSVPQKFDQFVAGMVDPEAMLDVTLGRARLLVFKTSPKRIYIADENVARYHVVSQTEISLVGTSPGKTSLYLWFDDPENPGRQITLSYLVQVAEDAAYKRNLEAAFAALEAEINRDFPDSYVKLSLIGDQVIVRGQAKDVIEADQIIRIVNEHAPPSRRQQNGPTSVSVNRSLYRPFESVEVGAEFEQGYDDTLTRLEGDPNVINMLVIPGEQQVMLRVTVAEVNRSALRSIGANMRIEGTSGIGFDSAFPQRVGDLVDTTLMVLEGGTFSVARGDFRLTIDALKQQNLAKTLAEPNLVTLHGKQAQFQAGGQFPVPAGVAGFGTAAQGVRFVPFGVQLQFTPYIVDRDKIRLNVGAVVSTRDDAQATNVSGSSVPGLSSRNFTNTVELRDGQTLAVAGLIQTNFGSNSSRVPGLGDLPFVGRLFKSDSTTADEQELVILITPELVHPIDSDHCLTLPGSDVFEPSDIEFYLKGSLESRRSYDSRSPVRTDWARLKRYRRCEDLFIIGPTGHCYGCRDQMGPDGHLFPGEPAMGPQTLNQHPSPTTLPLEVIPAPASNAPR